MQSYIMRVSQLRDQFQTIGETISDKYFVMITLQGIPPIWETFITTIRKKNGLPKFDELIGQCTQEETKMTSQESVQNHEEGEPYAFSTKYKKRKGRGRPSNSRNFSPKSKEYKRRFRKDKTQIECYNFHKYGHYI